MTKGLHVLPGCSIHCIKNSLGGDAVFSAELSKHATSVSVSRSDFTYLFSSKDSAILALTMSHTSFVYCILAILFGSSKKQMVRSYAQAIIAMMADLQSIRNRVIGKFIGYAMDKTASVNVAHITVSSRGFGTCPSPASIGVRSVNFAPKPSFKIALAWGILMRHLHNLLHRLVGVRSRLFPPALTPPHYTSNPPVKQIQGVYYA